MRTHHKTNLNTLKSGVDRDSPDLRMAIDDQERTNEGSMKRRQ
jgi:hypothetical protein